MANNLPHYTRCADPGIAHEFSVPGALMTLVGVGLVGYFTLAAVMPNPCAGVAAAALALVAALDSFEWWFYNERLM